MGFGNGTESGLDCRKASYYYVWKLINDNLQHLRLQMEKKGATSSEIAKACVEKAYSIAERSEVETDAMICIRDQICSWEDDGLALNDLEWQWEAQYATPSEIKKSKARKERAGGSYDKYPSQFK